jgi:hypothetical protein
MVVSTLVGLAQRRQDPLGIQLGLSLKGTYYPLGFPLQLSTNSPDVLSAAEESWGDQTRDFAAEPLVMRVVVHPEGELSGQATHRKQGHLYCVVSDADNFAHVDLRSQFAVVHVSQKTAADHSWLRWFFLEALAYLMLCQRQVVMVHAGCVARDGEGVLLCGASEAGKSTLSYACARAGWTWIADDCTCLLPDSTERIAIGRSRQARFRIDAPALFPELERFTARERPTGKIGIDVDMAAIPGIQTARRAPIGALAFLERRSGPAGAQAISGEEAVDRLLADMPSYGEEEDALHERTVRQLAAAPAYVARYESIEDGVRVVSGL